MVAVALGEGAANAEEPRMTGTKDDTTGAGTPPDTNAAKNEELKAAASMEDDAGVELTTGALLASVDNALVADGTTSADAVPENVTP